MRDATYSDDNDCGRSRAGLAPSVFSVTDATAFSPTDVMPLARWAKAAMTMQAAGSLLTLGLVIARAVTILR